VLGRTVNLWDAVDLADSLLCNKFVGLGVPDVMPSYVYDWLIWSLDVSDWEVEWTDEGKNLASSGFLTTLLQNLSDI
jgi:hypothetical protein